MTSALSPSFHDDLRRDLGVYVLGALEPAERERLERHVAACAECREELVRLAALPGLLQPLRDEPPEWSTATAPPVEPVLARIAGERRRARWAVRTAAAAAIIAVVLVAGQFAGRSRSPVAAQFVAAEVAASAVVQPRPWGSAVAFEGSLRDGEGYVLVAVAADGHRAQVASWSAVEHPITLDGSCYLEPGQIKRLEVLTSDDDVVAVLRPR